MKGAGSRHRPPHPSRFAGPSLSPLRGGEGFKERRSLFRGLRQRADCGAHLHFVGVAPGDLGVGEEIAAAYGGVDSRIVDAGRDGAVLGEGAGGALGGAGCGRSMSAPACGDP